MLVVVKKFSKKLDLKLNSKMASKFKFKVSFSSAKPGDRVSVSTSFETVEGLLLPRPSLLSDDVLVVKLSSGYNIGISKANIVKFEIIEKAKSVKPSSIILHSKNPSLPTVAVLSTGGTISSKVDYRTGGVYADYTAEDFLALCPELLRIANIRARKIAGVMSEDLSPKDWVLFAKEIVKELETADGVVLTHGTDTLHFTASALSFLLQNLNKPVVITGAQRSIDRGSSDAFVNLVCSINSAAHWDGAEVVSCLHANSDDDSCFLLRGVKVRKMHTSRRDAFRPINCLPLAKVYPSGKIDVLSVDYKKRFNILSSNVRSNSISDIKLSAGLKLSDEVAVNSVNVSKANLSSQNLKTFADLRLSDKVAMIYVYPGVDSAIVDYYVKRGVKGLVVAGTALGHVSTAGKNSFLDALSCAVKKGVLVVMTSQTLYGSTHPFVYSNLRRLSVGAGVVYLSDMLPETAYVKLMVALGRFSSFEKAKLFMQTNIVGEISVREVMSSFLF